MMRFPSDFLWGAATSSYQVEGHNSNADWWAWEKKAGKECSGPACEHWQRYEADFDLARGLNHNAHRLSIEWSRIEPKEGEFSQEAIQHYIDVIKALRARGLEPMVTLHHFTNPAWMADSGSWVKGNSVRRFLRYCDTVVGALAPYVHYWNTVNEPTIVISHAYMFGVWPPQGKDDYGKALVMHRHMAKAHIAAYKLINKIYRQQDLPKPAISIAHHISAFVACSPSLRNRMAVKLRDKLFSFAFLDILHRAGTLDFIGLNYYSRQRVDTTSWWIGNMLAETCSKDHDPMPKNALGWDIYPQGLYQVLVKLHRRYNLPIVITENGICIADDNIRWEFIRAHLGSVHRAIQEGVKVKGYMYWSLLDNFEWAFGYGPRFGLIDVDYQTQQRTVRDSARKYAEVCRTGTLA